MNSNNDFSNNYSIDFFFEDIIEIPFPENFLREWIFLIIQHESKEPGFLNIIFCNDNYLVQLNHQFLEHDTYTDIITFDYTEEFNSISGDIFISLDRVGENAIKFNTEFNLELARVIGHGILHICGYKDKSSDEIALMRSKEDYYLEMIKF